METCTPDYIGFVHLEVEQILEEIEVRMNAEESLAQMNEGGDMKNGVRVQMDQLDPIKMEKTPKKLLVGRANPR